MFDVGAICWWADQVNFRVSRVLHTAQATESRNSVQPPNLPTVVIDHCIPRFCCHLCRAFHNDVGQQKRVICEHNRNCYTFGGCQQTSVPKSIHFRLGQNVDEVSNTFFSSNLTVRTVPGSSSNCVSSFSVDDTAGSFSSTNVHGIHGKHKTGGGTEELHIRNINLH